MDFHIKNECFISVTVYIYYLQYAQGFSIMSHYYIPFAIITSYENQIKPMKHEDNLQ